ncbi:MAG: GGDEF domain-containing protein [Pseudomonadales bacterium]
MRKLRATLQRIANLADQANHGSGLNGLESHRRAFLLNVMSGIGIAFLLILGINCYLNNIAWLGTFLISIASLGTLNLIWLYRDNNYQRAAQTLSFCIIVLAAVLLVSGGVENTGLFWVFPLVSMAIFISGFLVGIILVAMLMLFSTALLLIPDNFILMAEYPPAIVSRFLISILALGVMCLTSELTRFKSQREVARLHQEISVAANTDSLTSLHNRRFVQEQVIQHNRFRNEVTQGGMILLADIDHFKHINDRYGHDVGDSILQRVAACLMECTRDGDIVARWGGEEFLIILPNITPEIAYKRAEHFRQTIAAMDFKATGETFSITMSFGLCSIQNDTTASELLKRSDENLYAAKAAGRNCIVPSAGYTATGALMCG